MFFWHGAKNDKEKQELPIARGNDYEAVALLKAPTAWPVYLNIGGVYKGAYNSDFGIQKGEQIKVEPGHIFESKLSLEIPLRYHLNLLGESAYYYTGAKKIADASIPGSAGSALDLLAGLNWSYGGWNIGAGIAFGILNQQLASFDLERGAGDELYKFKISYLLVPRSPER